MMSCSPYGYEEVYVETFTPNDYGGPVVFAGDGQPELDYINAQDAWDITTGSPNVVIGITDTYFDTTHPELSSQIVNVRQNNPISSPHGTAVAGIVAGATNNNNGISSIGFNCKLDISNGSGVYGRTSEMLNMSRDGIKILNGSWYRFSDPAGSYGMNPDVFILQGVYNEVYENGAIPFFGAANYADQASGRDGYAYPASLDHCMSITSVGSRYDIGTITYDAVADAENHPPGGMGGHNWKGVHQIDALLPSTDDRASHHHNDRVDLAAPGYYFKLLHYDPDPPNWEYYWGPGIWASGTSYASPMTAGTAGLMLSVNSCLSPYQIEYILKKSANDDIYDISYNAPYIGKLGAGALDAGAAVAMAQGFDCNDYISQTFFIKGVTINTICAPGFSSNGASPKMQPVLQGGTPPYTYKWEPIPGNTATLSNYNVAEPTITSSAPTALYPDRKAFYRLTVYDNSDIQKVANKIISINLDTAGYDLAMRDSYLDMLDEPNSQQAVDPRAWDIWAAPDIWNRQKPDGMPYHQNPEYYTTDSNYLYVRIRNVGCEPSPANADLRLYWSLASTGEKWPGDWTTANFPPNPSLPAVRQITTTPIDIPVIQPGDATLITKGWRPQDPSLYGPLIGPPLQQLDACVLARIEESSSYPYGMAINEIGGNVKHNVLNNNNIITRNFVIRDLAEGDKSPLQHLVLVANAELTTENYTIQLINDRAIHPQLSGDLSQVLRVKLSLGKTLYSKWQAGGLLGEYAAKDDTEYTVTFDGSSTLELNNIQLLAGEKHAIYLEFELKDPDYIPERPFTIHFRQFVDAETPELYGNVTYVIKPEDLILEKGTSISEGVNQKNHRYNIYPNPVRDEANIVFNGDSKNATILVYDIMGREVKRETDKVLGRNPYILDTKSLPVGLYMITIKDAKANRQESLKIIKEAH